MLHIYIYIYIYVCVCMQRGLCSRVYIAIYEYIQGIYAYIEPCKHIYRSYIYVFAMFICLLLCILCAVCVQMYAN